MDDTTLAQQIADAKTILAAITAAITALADLTVQSYTLDTGQSVETVKRTDLPKLLASRRSMQNELCTLQARQTGSGVVHVVPGW